jgi:Peroxiredoxin
MALINTQIKPFKANAFKDGELIEVSSEDIAGKWGCICILPG